jgi:hypothetical protein
MVKAFNVDAEADDELVGGDRGHYTGDMLHDVRHGVGSYQYPNKFFHYQGDYVNGKKHGQGTFTLGDGSVYKGDFHDDEIEGHGTRTWPNGAVYIGEFKLGEMDGEGELIGGPGSLLPQDSSSTWNYLGHWRQNRREGPGILYFTNGDRYEGLFHNHRQHDEAGALYCANGDVYEGGWEAGERSGGGRYTSRSGDTYEGQWAHGVREGEGCQTYRNGLVWRGEWKGGALAGRPLYLQLFTEGPAPEAAGENDPAPAEGQEAEAPAGGEDGATEGSAAAESDAAAVRAPPLLPAVLTVVAGATLPALTAMAVVTPAAEPPAPEPLPTEDGEAAPEEEEEEKELVLLPPVTSEGESGRVITVSLVAIPAPEPAPEAEEGEEPAPEPEPASEPEPEAELQPEQEQEQEQEEGAVQPAAPVRAALMHEGEEGLVSEVSVRTIDGVASFPSVSLRCSAPIRAPCLGATMRPLLSTACCARVRCACHRTRPRESTSLWWKTRLSTSTLATSWWRAGWPLREPWRRSS